MQKLLKKYINLKRLSFLPSWSILFIDIFITTSVALFTFVTFRMIGVDFYETLQTSVRFSIYLGVIFFYFFLFKTYTGIIRYSSLKDATRIFKAIAFAFTTIVAFDAIYFMTYGKHVFVIMTIFFSSLVIIFALISFRIFIKTLFKYFAGNEEKPKAENLVIIGVNSTTIALAEAFVNDNTQYKLQFFTYFFLVFF